MPMSTPTTTAKKAPERADPDSPNGREGEDQRKDDPEKKEGEGKKDDKESEGGEKKEDAPEKKKPFRPSRKAIVIAAVIVLVLIILGVLWWLHARNFVDTDDAYTTAHIHQISSRVAGIVTEVRVDDNQHVRAGDVLAQLDPRDYTAAAQTARAGLLQAQAQFLSQEAAIAQAGAQVSVADAKTAQARAQMEQAAAQLEKARLDYDRVVSLYSKDFKAVSKSDVDTVTEALQSARGNMESARAAVSAAASQAEASRSSLHAAQADSAVAQANIGAGQSKLRQAELQLSYCNIVSPVAGKVSKKTVETGQQLQPGQALMAIVPDDVWVLANLKETQLEWVRVGQRVDVKIDTLPDFTFYGRVNSIQEGSGATFSLLPPDNATGNFTKIVQRVPVKIVFDRDSVRDFVDKIVPGLSVEPSIDIGGGGGSRRREAKRMKVEDKQNRRWEKENK